MKLFYTLILATSWFCTSAQHQPSLKTTSKPSVSPDIYTFAEREQDFEYLSAPDSAGNRVVLKTPDLTSNSPIEPVIPYPIIFIHGLNSSSETWKIFSDYLDKQYAFTFGGRLDFCLNFDRSNTTSNTLIGTTPGGKEDIALFNSTLIAGDYYFVNFDVGYNGSFHPQGNAYDVLSNQSAIVKQGVAIKWAIQEVLKKTGRDKVILMGHSMGGLVAREYLQNPANWQPDGNHHVAKLVTTGTPHGGSNTTAYGLGIGGINEQSEAVRDLRSSYYYSKEKGVYLWGGLEFQNSTHMNDMYDSGLGFYNVDVNSNGSINETIIGLNEKKMIKDVDYSCIIGKCSGCIIATEAGDGVVTAINADLKNIYSTASINQFYYEAYAVTEIHTALPALSIQNMQGLDEPNAFNLAYAIGLDTLYTGFTTVQSPDGNAVDDDLFKFKIETAGTLSVNVNKPDLTDLTVDVYDASYNKICATVHSSGVAIIHFNQVVAPGNYYLVISNKPITTSYLHPYSFILNNSITIGIGEYNNENTLIFPNPVSAKLNIRSDNYRSENLFFEIWNDRGQEVMKIPYSNSVDVSKLSNGIYFLKIKIKEEVKLLKFVKE